MALLFLWKFILLITLFKEVYMHSNTVVDDVSVNDLYSCEYGWKHYDQYCFKLVDVLMPWRNASSICNIMGGHLASIHSKEQNDFFEDFNNKTDESFYWIGLHDHAWDGIFAWDDGVDVDYTNWGPKEPDGNFSKGNCVAVSITQSSDFPLGSWLVGRCDANLLWLCQKKISQQRNTTKENCDCRVATSSLESTAIHSKTTTSPNTSMELDNTTITTPANTRTDIERENITSSKITRTDIQRENNTSLHTNMQITYGTGFISITSHVITIIMIIVFMALMGGLLYCKRHWLKEKRSRLSTVFSSRAGQVTDPSSEFILEPKSTI